MRFQWLAALLFCGGHLMRPCVSISNDDVLGRSVADIRSFYNAFLAAQQSTLSSSAVIRIQVVKHFLLLCTFNLIKMDYQCDFVFFMNKFSTIALNHECFDACNQFYGWKCSVLLMLIQHLTLMFNTHCASFDIFFCNGWEEGLRLAGFVFQHEFFINESLWCRSASDSDFAYLF